MSLDTTYTHQQPSHKNQVSEFYDAQLGAHFINSTSLNQINISQNVHPILPVDTIRKSEPQNTAICEASHKDQEERFNEVMRCSLLKLNRTKSKAHLYKMCSLNLPRANMPAEQWEVVRCLFCKIQPHLSQNASPQQGALEIHHIEMSCSEMLKV